MGIFQELILFVAAYLVVGMFAGVNYIYSKRIEMREENGALVSSLLLSWVTRWPINVAGLVGIKILKVIS